MTIAALSTDETLLILKGALLLLLYVFILFVARSATKDLAGAPQESIILGPAEAEVLRSQVRTRSASFVVVTGPGRRAGGSVTLTGATLAGRDAGCAIRLDDDDFASSRHAKLEPGGDGVWIEDLGSTNGTFVNGERIAARTLVRPGDVVRIGQTELRLES